MVRAKGTGGKCLQGLLVGVAGIAAALSLWAMAWLDPWEAGTWDWRTALLAKPAVSSDDIRLILLDQNSLDWALKENGLAWPWPRELYGAILNFCKRGSAQAVAFDVLYTEPSTYGHADDETFVSAVSDYGRFVGTVFLGNASGKQTSWPSQVPPPVPITGLKKWLAEPRGPDTVFPRATLPILPLAEAASLLCNIHLSPDADGIYRRVKLFSVFDGKPLVSLGIGTFLAAHPGQSVSIRPGRLTVGDTKIPIDHKGGAVLRYRGPTGTYRAFSAAAVLQSEIRIINGQTPLLDPRESFQGKYVLFGFSAPGLFDLRSAPVGGIFTGVEIHATMLDNLLADDFIQPAPIWIVIVLLICLCVGCGLAATRYTHTAATIGIIALFGALPPLFSLGAYLKGIWLPLVVSEIGVVVTIAIALVFNYATEGRQKRFIKNAFQQYLSPDVIEQLLQNPERLKLGGERRVLSIFFSDLQGFTSISEGLEPEALTHLLNDYLSAMTDIIHEEGGTVDKYEGDAIIAFWNAPLAVTDHADRVVQAALRCQEALARLRPGFKKHVGQDLLMRVGINTGPAVVGNLGSHTRFDYTMLGDAVNLAARLEGINKQFGTYTMISEFTRQTMGKAFAVRELAKVAVVGRKEPVTVFEPMRPDAYRKAQTHFNRFEQGLDLFYQGRFEQARTLFSALMHLDPAAAAYEKKCRALLETPPGRWDGVWVMTTK